MSEEAFQNNPKRLNFGLLLLISFMLIIIGCIVDQTVRWSNPTQGLINGLFHLLFFGLGWCFFFLPWSLIVFALYHWRKWKRFRTQWVLAPAVLVFLFIVGNLVFQPPTPSKRFKRHAKTELPTNVQNLHYHFTGGGLADYGDTYYFETTPAEVDRIIDEMRLDRDERYGQDGFTDTTISSLPNCPDYSTWENATLYKGWDDKQHWFYYLITDETRTKVYMLVGCI